jgi:hypothetical protein
MIWLEPLARPLFKWNHDAVMKQGGEALARLPDGAASGEKGSESDRI